MILFLFSWQSTHQRKPFSSSPCCVLLLKDLNFKLVEQKGMSVIGAYSHFLYGEVYQRDQQCPQYLVSGRGYFFSHKSGCGNIWVGSRKSEGKIIKRRNFRVEAMWPDLSRPSELEMEEINDSEQLDQILVHAQQNSQPILIDWLVLLSLSLHLLYNFFLL